MIPRDDAAQPLRPLSERQQIAVDIVEDFDAAKFPENEHFQRCEILKMARKMWKKGCQMADCRAAIGVMSNRVPVDEQTLWEYFITAWEDIKIKPGRDIRWAYEQTLGRPIPLPDGFTNPSNPRQIGWGISCYLSESHHPKPFELSRERLAEVLGMTKMGASLVVKSLVRNGLIVPLNEDGDPAECEDDEHYVRNRSCKRYQLRSKIPEKVMGLDPLQF
jgi:hypothetical protein